MTIKRENNKKLLKSYEMKKNQSTAKYMAKVHGTILKGMHILELIDNIWGDKLSLVALMYRSVNKHCQKIWYFHQS